MKEQHLNPLYRFLFIDQSLNYSFYISHLIQSQLLPIYPFFAIEGKSGIDHLNQIKTDEFPDVIIADADNPTVNAFQMVREYEKHFISKYPDTLLYLASNNCHNGIRRKIALYPSVTDLLQKPFTKYTFEHIILPKIGPLYIDESGKGLVVE